MSSIFTMLSQVLNKKFFGLVFGPFFFIIIYTGLVPFVDLNQEAQAVLAIASWIAIWWMTEAIPISATSLIPMVMLPLTGGAPIDQTTAAYGDKMLFLFLGGFIIAIGMQKWDLHKRIALTIILAIGSKSNTLILGFMCATGFLSMWISNTATTLMMVTIATALISQISNSIGDKGGDFFKALLLSIAFSANVGGVATLVGTPTNPIFVSIAEKLYGQDFHLPLGWLLEPPLLWP